MSINEGTDVGSTVGVGFGVSGVGVGSSVESLLIKFAIIGTCANPSAALINHP